MLETDAKMQAAELIELREVSILRSIMAYVLRPPGYQGTKTLENLLQETIEKEERALDAADDKGKVTTGDAEDPSATIKALKVRRVFRVS